jgi:hypothetical protein
MGVGSVRSHPENDDIFQKREPVGISERAPLIGTRRVKIEGVEYENYCPSPVSVLRETVPFDRSGSCPGEREIRCLLADTGHVN